MHLAAFATNYLRPDRPTQVVRRARRSVTPAKRRRIKTVLQEVMYRAAKFVEHARRLVLDFGRVVAM